MRATPDFDCGLSETAVIIRDAAASFPDERIAPLAASIDTADRFPRELWPAMGELGLQTTRFDAAGAILLASKNAFRVAGEAIQALGGAGSTKDWPVERFLRDAKLLDIGAGTNEIRHVLIGRELIGA